MSGLVETGRAGRCVQMDRSEITSTGGNFGPDGRVIDHWAMHPTEYPDGRYHATAVATGDEVDPTYLVVVTSTDNALLRDLSRAKLPADMGISVDAVVIMPKQVQTDDSARRVMRRLMQAAADDQVPMAMGDNGFDRVCWTATTVGVVYGLTAVHAAV